MDSHTVPCPKHKCPKCREENINGQKDWLDGEKLGEVDFSDECTYHKDEHIEWMDEKVAAAGLDEHKNDSEMHWMHQ